MKNNEIQATSPKPSRHKINKGTRKILLLIIIAISIIATPLIYKLYTEMTHKKAEIQQMSEIADQFEPDSRWTWIKKNQPEATLLDCSVFVDCPSISKIWVTDQPVAGIDLQRMSDAAGWDIDFTGKCELDNKFEYYGCYVDGTQGDYRTTVNVTEMSNDGLYRLIIYVDKDYSGQ